MCDFMVFNEIENGGYGVSNERFVAEYNAEGEMTCCVGAKTEAPRKIIVHKRQASRIETPQAATGTCRVSMGKLCGNEPHRNTAAFTTDKFEVHSGIDANIKALIENALKNHAQCAARNIKKQLADDQKAMDELTSHVKHVMLLECFPGGILHRNFGRR